MADGHDARHATTWGAGDYPQMAMELVPVALAAVVAAAVGPDDRVLDVATGTGNAALLAADHSRHVVGVDFEPALLGVAEQRALASGRSVRWLVGDVSALPVDDSSADVVLSVFGAMYAADHDAAVRELARVAAPGARIVLASWTPGGVQPAMGQVLSPYLPAPPDSTGPPSRWGDPDALASMLGRHDLRMGEPAYGRVFLRFAGAAAGADFLIRTAGHVVSEQARLEAEGRWHALREDLSAFVEERGVAAGDHVDLALDFLLVTARTS